MQELRHALKHVYRNKKMYTTRTVPRSTYTDIQPNNQTDRYRQADRLIDWHTERYIAKESDRDTDRQTYTQTDKHKHTDDRHTGIQTGRQTLRHKDLQTGRKIDRQEDRHVDRYTDK